MTQQNKFISISLQKDQVSCNLTKFSEFLTLINKENGQIDFRKAEEEIGWSDLNKWNRVNLISIDNDHMTTLTPRGQDLAASLPLLMIEEEKQESNQIKCFECGDTKEVSIIRNFTIPCKACSNDSTSLPKMDNFPLIDIDDSWRFKTDPSGRFNDEIKTPKLSLCKELIVLHAKEYLDKIDCDSSEGFTPWIYMENGNFLMKKGKFFDMSFFEIPTSYFKWIIKVNKWPKFSELIKMELKRREISNNPYDWKEIKTYDDMVNIIKFNEYFQIDLYGSPHDKEDIKILNCVDLQPGIKFNFKEKYGSSKLYEITICPHIGKVFDAFGEYLTDGINLRMV